MLFSRQSIIKNFIWKFAERCGAQGISFVVAILLARLLSPTDYGTIALVQVLLTILSVFVDSGLGSALIQKKEADTLDFSSAFFLNVVVSLLLYIVVWCIAPYLASFYGMPEITVLIRVLSLILLISALRNVQQAYVSKHMLFKKFFYSTVGAAIVSAIVGVGMALWGWGVWSLVAQQLVDVLVGTIVLWITVPWRPKLEFSLKRIKGLFSYGWKLLTSALLDTGYQQLWQLLIGKAYSPADLAFVNQGQKYPNFIVSNINSSIDSILFPVLSQAQNDLVHLRNMMRRAICVSSFLLWPLMMLLAAMAEPLVRLLMTEKWLPLVPYLQVFCFSYALWPIHTANLNGIKAIGRSDIFLRLEIIKKLMGLCILVVTISYGTFVMACGIAASGLVSTFINSWPNRKLLGYSYREQWKDITPGCLLAILVGGVVYPLGHNGWPDALVVVVEGLLGLLLYVLLAYVLKLEALAYLVQTAKKK